MPKLTAEYVKTLFSPLAERNFPAFFANVAPDVDWLVPPWTGHPQNPIAGHYTDLKSFAAALAPLGKCVQSGGIGLKVAHVTVDADENRAAVELSARETQKNGKPFNNDYTWVCQFDENGEKIVAVRAYLDTQLIVDTLEGNKDAWQ